MVEYDAEKRRAAREKILIHTRQIEEPDQRLTYMEKLFGHGEPSTRGISAETEKIVGEGRPVRYKKYKVESREDRDIQPSRMLTTVTHDPDTGEEIVHVKNWHQKEMEYTPKELLQMGWNKAKTVVQEDKARRKHRKAQQELRSIQLKREQQTASAEYGKALSVERAKVQAMREAGIYPASQRPKPPGRSRGMWQITHARGFMEDGFMMDDPFSLDSPQPFIGKSNPLIGKGAKKTNLINGKNPFGL